MVQITVRGPSATPVVHRLAAGLIRIGRAATCEVCLPDAQLSRVHAEIRPDGDGWLLMDCGSRNGTHVNGQRVDGTVRVRAGDEIRMGSLTLSLESAAVPSGAAAANTLSARGPRPGSALGATDEQPLVGTSSALVAVRALVARVAPMPATVLVTGESGTGKELVARLLHRLSPRAAGPFVVVNCPALPPSLVESELFGVEKGVATGVEAREGKLALAEGGTLMLDEVGDLDLAAQAKLLRFLQDKTVERLGSRRPVTVDARVVAATNRDLEQDVQSGAFRADLFQRLAAVTVHLPPLRERPEDIPALVEHFLARPDGPRVSMSAAALKVLTLHAWRGNVRALEQVVALARYVTTGQEIQPADLPASLGAASNPEAVPPSTAATLYEQVVVKGQSFWAIVHEPFLRRALSREDVRQLIETAWLEGGRSYKGAARLLGIAAQYKKLVNFVQAHDLGVREEG